MRHLLLALAAWMSVASSSAQPVRAVTETGDSVVLFSDGVWARDDGSAVLPAIRSGQRHASEWFRYAVWHPDGWTTMNAVEAYYDGEIAFVPGGDRDSVVVTMAYIPMESVPMEEGEARQRVVERYAELFGMRVPIRQRSMAGHRVTTLDMTDLDSPTQSLVSAVTAPGGAILINVYAEGTGAPIEAIANRFLTGLEIEAAEDPAAFLRDPCDVYLALENGFALDVPEGWIVNPVDVRATGVDAILARPESEGGEFSAFAAITTALLEDASAPLASVAQSLVLDIYEEDMPADAWEVSEQGPWPPGLPRELATAGVESPEDAVYSSGIVVREGSRAALMLLTTEGPSGDHPSTYQMAQALRVCADGP